jgi:hypothetical protein
MFAYYARRMFRFVLRDTDMNDLGSVTFSTTTWSLGDVFTTGDGRKLRIVDMLNLPEQDAVDLRLGGVWVVEPAD